jgi:hypothetical protein
LAGFEAAPPAVEAKQQPEANRQARRKARADSVRADRTGKSGKAGKAGKSGKSFVAAFLSKVAGETKSRSPAGAASRAPAAGAAKLSVSAAAEKAARPGRRPAPARSTSLPPDAAALPGGGGVGGAGHPAGKEAARAAAAVQGRNAKTGPRVQPRLVVLDLRRAAAVKKPQVRTAPAPEARSEATARGETPEFRLAARPAAGPAADLALPAAPEQASQPSRNAGAQIPQSLLRAWQEKMVPEVVRHTGIIVRDGGDGEIRLILKPETLGNVRIRITINNNSVEGRIVVENNSVKELFDASLDNLKASLRQEGFQSASLEVSVGNQRTRQEAENRQQVLTRLDIRPEEVSQEFDRLVPQAIAWPGGDFRVNLVV